MAKFFYIIQTTILEEIHIAVDDCDLAHSISDPAMLKNGRDSRIVFRKAESTTIDSGPCPIIAINKVIE